MKCEKSIPTIKYDGDMAAHFVFNHTITQLEISYDLLTNHGRNFQNKMMKKLALKLGYKKEHSSSYYPQADGHVELFSKSLKAILPRTIAQTKTNWNIMIYHALWDYRSAVKTITKFSPY